MQINQYGIYEISNVISIVAGVVIILKALEYAFFNSLNDKS